MQINHGLIEPHQKPAAQLISRALAEKLVPIMGSEEMSAKLLEGSFAPKRCLCAVNDAGVLVGILAYQYDQRSFINPSLNDTLKHTMDVYGAGLGPIRGLWRWLQLAMLDHKNTQNEFYIEAIAVAKHARGQGVGSKLVRHAFELAASKRFERVTLSVIDTNKRAKNLYKKLGFHEFSEQALWPVNRLIGWQFQRITHMQKVIAV